MDESAARQDEVTRARALPLVALLMTAGLLRLLFVFSLPTDAASLQKLPDQVEYLQLAKNLLDGRGLVLHDDRFDQDVYAYRMPGYPAFVAMLGADVRLVRGAQVLLDVSTILATVLIARRWLPERTSLLAGAVVALNPFLIYFTGLILSETLYTASLVWGVYWLIDARRRVWWMGLPALLLGTYVRPGAVALPVVLAIATTLLNWREWASYHKRSTPRGARFALAWYVALLAVFGTVVVLIPWVLRNQRLLASPVWLTSNGGITAYDGFNALQFTKPWTERGGSDQTFTRMMPELARMNEIERDQYLKQQARKFMTTHPADVLGLTILKVLRTWSPVPLSADYGNRPAYVLAGVLYGVPLLILTVVGIVRRNALPRGAKLVLLTPALYFTAVHAMTVGSLRYRVPVEPLLVVVACGAFGAKRETSEQPNSVKPRGV